MTVLDGFADTFRQIPGAQQHGRVGRVILAELLLFVREPIGMRCGMRELAIEVPRCTIDGQYGHVLEECSEEHVLGLSHFCGFAKSPGASRGEERASPKSWIVDADGTQGSHRRDERETERERERRVQPDDYQRLA